MVAVWIQVNAPRVRSTDISGRNQLPDMNECPLDRGLPRVRIRVFNATFNNILVIMWHHILLVEETGVSGKKPSTCCKSLTNFIT
jgi:hypothetical protein